MTNYIILRSLVAGVMWETTVNCNCLLTDNLTFGMRRNNLYGSEHDVVGTCISISKETECSENICCCTIRRQSSCSVSIEMKENPECSELSEKISMYDEVGPFLTHLPEFAAAADFFIQGTQSKLKKCG